MLGRTLIVNISGQKSDPFAAHSGVLQGSHMGSLLFIVFVNNLIFVVKYAIEFLIAHDLKLSKVANSDKDQIELQDDSGSIMRWSDMNCLDFNIGKCNIASFPKAKGIAFDYEYKFSNILLKRPF